ncbi:MAG: RnfABCDGE type electron transport complex subunit G [Lachnospiraceae bacterium]|nr:RnfABCDGE type electron transport complex subunit G [Lachnospiraceae bacterium]
MLKDAGILFAITLIAGLILGFVYELTKEPIRVQQELAIQRACREVFADASSFEALKYVPGESVQADLNNIGVEIGTVFEARDVSGNPVGYVVETTTHEGYAGDITLYAGITNEGMLNGISILSIAETPGLGMNAETVLVPQFENVPANMFNYTKTGSSDPNVVDAISGATITTDAVCSAVNGAVYVVMVDFLMKGGN